MLAAAVDTTTTAQGRRTFQARLEQIRAHGELAVKVWRTLFAAAEFISPGGAVATAFSGAGTVERVEERFESMLAVAESDVSAHEGSMSMMCVFNSMLTVDAAIAQAKVRGDESFLTRREGPTLKSSEEAWVLAQE